MIRSAKIHLAPWANHSGIVRLAIAATILCGSAALRSAHADNMVTDWDNEFLLITQQTSGNLVSGPPEVAREIAQMGEAMSDAVNAASGSTISYFAYTGGSMANADQSVAAATAAYTALYDVFTDPVWSTPIDALTTNAALAGNTSNTTLATNVILPELSSFLSSELTSLCGTDSAGCSNTSTYTNGYSLGVAAATAVDNATATSPTKSGAVASIENGLNNNTPTTGPNLQPGVSGTTPGVYVPPSAARPEMFPTWGGVTPSGISTAQLSAAEASVPGPPPISSPAYAIGLLQTECEGSSGGFASLPANVQTACTNAGFTQTPTQAQASALAALFWNDPGTTIQPPGHWLQIADTAMLSQNTSLLQSAQLTALLGEGMNDAGIAAWDEKYTYNLWRPITAITSNCNSDGSVSWSSSTPGAGGFVTCDPTWKSLIATPPHPDYLAGHPAFSGAAATVLADFFGTDNIAFSSVSDYYCNGATSSQFGPTNLLVSCTMGTGVNAVVYYVSDPNNGGQPDCATIVNGANTNNSPLICPITETFDSFSEASSGTNGAEFSRVVGGIHTPFSVEDALTLGDGIGQDVMLDAPEPSTLSICAISLLALIRVRRRRAFQV
jgi:hypothetical protein